jgi:cation diffusion facilitator CzcD-associated flavoprotein CzcO
VNRYDAIIIGSGISGMCQLHMLRQQGMSVKVVEAGSGVGGTWYWNRYPGCRFDSETYSYCYSFSEEILQEWDWSEHFAPQTETREYLNFVADKLDLRKDIEFNTRVSSARFDESNNCWVVMAQDGRTFTGTFLITAIGILSASVTPNFPDRAKFEGRSFHTSDWPREEGFDLSGKRVAVVGTGATGIQVIQEVAKIAKSLTVFQKEANWAKPLLNSKISPDEMKEIKENYPQYFERCNKTSAAFLHDWEPRNTFDVSEEEREVFYEAQYNKRGFALWLGNYQDLAINAEAAQATGEFVARKIRQRVRDQKVADILIPKDHLFGTRRIPLETNYFEVYNQDNVDLIDVNANPIERFTAGGIVVDGQERLFDVVIFATGFDAVRGAFDRIDFEGVGGVKLRDKWREGPVTYMGLQISDFPNMFTLVGPHSAATFCNVPRCSEQSARFVGELMRYMRNHGYDRSEASPEAEDAWTDFILESAETLLASKTDSWFTGINVNLPGRQKRRMLLYSGGQQYYHEYCADVVAQNYRGFNMSRQAESATVQVAK